MIRSLAAVSVGWLGISMLADGIPALLVPYQLGVGGATATSLGLLTMIGLAVAAAIQPVAGAWTDRVGRTWGMGAGVAVSIAGLGLLVSPALVVPGTIVTLAGVSIVQAGYQSLLPDRVRPTWRGRGAGAKGLFDIGGAFLAFTFLGFVLANGQPILAVAGLAVGLGASVVLAVLLAPAGSSGAAQEAPRSHGGPVAMPGSLIGVVAARFLFLFGVYAVGRFLLLFVAERFELGRDAAAGETATLLGVLAVITALASLPAGWLADRIGRRQLMISGGLIASVGIATLAVADAIAITFAGGGAMAVGTALFGAGSWAVQADLVDGHHSGKLLGLANLGTAGAAACAGLVGLLIDGGRQAGLGDGFGIAFGVASAAALAGGIVGWQAVARKSPMAAPAAPEVSV